MTSTRVKDDANHKAAVTGSAYLPEPSSSFHCADRPERKDELIGLAAFNLVDQTPNAPVSVHNDEHANGGSEAKHHFRVAYVDKISDKGFTLYKRKQKHQSLSNKYSIVVMREFDEDKTALGTTVELRQAQGLLGVLQNIYKGVDNMKLHEVPPEISTHDLYHANEQMIDHAKKLDMSEPEERETFEQLQLALNVIQLEFAGESSTIKSLLAKGEISFSLLWVLYPRNELIISTDTLKQTIAYFVKFGIDFKNRNERKCFGLEACYVDHNGEAMGFVRKGWQELYIEEFPGSRKISELPFYPLRYVKDNGIARGFLLERGKKRIRIGTSKLHDCSGHGIRTQHDIQGKQFFEPFQCEGHVIIDHSTFGHLCPGDGLNPFIYRLVDRDNLSDEQIMTMPAISYGFHLGKKIWGGFLVRDIAPIEWHPEIFEQLILPSNKKDLIELLVREHSSTNDNFDDFVKNKGRGLIGLLSGPPGVGKTLTVEAIAEIAQRPLYSINSGELGIDAAEIDSNLGQALQIAEIWEAVVLLDEADVFMFKRSSSDLEHNAVVSVFLKRLEYYRGILLLTTNRVDTMDAAFESRIHFRLSLPDLDSNARLLILKAHLTRLSTSVNVDLRVSDEEYAILAEKPFNGRQIKNTIRLLSLLVSKSKRPVKLEHIEAVIF